MNRRAGFAVVLLAACFVLVFAPAAQAYLDPGSGSFIFQALIGGLLAGAVAFKSFGRRFWLFITRRKRRDDAEEGTPEQVG